VLRPDRSSAIVPVVTPPKTVSTGLTGPKPCPWISRGAMNGREVLPERLTARSREGYDRGNRHGSLRSAGRHSGDQR
jgi:hypothetical protein